ncbi:YjjG family noncanonical pyrimidine nucleotidase [Williamwhitmania taraxaci]|uniref:Putative hydrolase of the HAD superfamily n=1 Tax=Williamwhitmania taraxaci TaxID=1640674 RepID=A0A1G6JGP3_9BACT|nr:YjjG family noncanonical pyrimidine nucleotidase [Williamwhitmania taraxaci]SDC17899.1 putative hydrolase of the HAD superfamily [Williamwhitmania taraxaci]
MLQKLLNRLTVRHIFFDLDRTLWDFEMNSRETLEELFYELLASRTNMAAEEFIKIYHKHNERLWSEYQKGAIKKEMLRWKRFQLTFKELGIVDNALAQQFDKAYIARSPQKTNLFPGTIETLLYLSKHYRLHIITNGFLETQSLKIDNAGITPFIQHMTTSEEAGHQKPEAGAFEYSLKKTGAKVKNSIMVGDDLEIDIVGASNFGMKQVFFNPEKQKHNFHPTWEIVSLLELKHIF